MYRCILFEELFPKYIVRIGRMANTFGGEAKTPEEAMMVAVEEIIGQKPPAWLREYTIWQPSTGIVFVNGKPCGTVFEVMSRGKIFEERIRNELLSTTR